MAKINPTKIRQDIPWFKNNPKITFLDSSATSLKPKQVIAREMEYYEKFGCSPHNKDSIFSYQTSVQIEEVRDKVASLLNVNSSEIIFTSGATESLNLIANGVAPFITKNDEIILTHDEHTSNILPWQNIALKNKAKIKYVGEGLFPTEKDILNAINQKTKIIAFCNVSNILGYKLNYKLIAKKAKEINPTIIIVVDATQAIPHMKHDLKNSGVDFLVFSGHKMLGPTGIGVCYIKHEWAKKIAPIRLGGGMNAIVDDNSWTYANIPDKFEGGTTNMAGIFGLGAAIDYLNKLGWKNIEAYEYQLKKYANEKLSSIKNLEFVNKFSKLPILFFNIIGCSSQDLANYLGSKKIIVRAGLSCAKLSYKNTKVNQAVRASLYIYNTKKDIDTLVKVLKEYKKGDELKHVIF